MTRQAESRRRLTETKALEVKAKLVPLGCTRADLSQLDTDQFVLLCGHSGLQCVLFANNPNKPRETKGVMTQCPEKLTSAILLPLLPTSV